MTYPEAIQFLYKLRWFGTKFGLTNTVKLAELAGNPHRTLRFIHVAGTNGKGSTCAMLEGIYRSAGLRVGLFTSPHLVAFGERIQLDRKPIPENEVVRLVAEMEPLLRHFSVEEHPTFFEVITVMALRYFAEQKCDLIIWETGLGGRLDATNIVTPLASVITNIQFDHQIHLGNTLTQIASEKAGIIKPGVPVITGADEAEALKVIRETAAKHLAPLRIVTSAEAKAPPLDTAHLSLLGHHQKNNAAVALAVVNILAGEIPVREETVRLGLGQVHWPGRLQLVTRSSGQRVLLDGAHNVAGAEVLALALKEHFSGLNPTLILGILRDKDWIHMCEILAPLASRILLVPVHSERSAEPHGLAEASHRANPRVQVSEFGSLAAALAETDRDPFITIAGSLYLVGEAMELLHLCPTGREDERNLNEWGPPGRRT